jgi:hypothetical protein
MLRFDNEGKMRQSQMTRISALGLLLLLPACTVPGNDGADRYQVSQGTPPEESATLTIAHIETGFLMFGMTTSRVMLVDGQKLPDRYYPPPAFEPPALVLGPGPHSILVRSFRDPVAAYACIKVNLDKAHAYTLHTTAPDTDGTTIWVEDTASGTVVGEKVQASAFREPMMSGALVQMVLAHPAVECSGTPNTK